MTEKRFFLKRRFLRKDEFHDVICNRCMDSKETEKALNRLYDKYSSLKKENENLNNVLEDFMTITNRLQAEPNNKSLQIMARDMLQMMGKDIMGDSE